MSKAFISQILFETNLLSSKRAANLATRALFGAIVKELRRSQKFTLPSFGTFTVRKIKAHKGMNPSTGEKIRIKACKNVRFKASRTLRKAV